MDLLEMKAAEVVLDYNLYPRHKIDATHVQHIRAALRAGEALPPPVVDRRSRRATDGFHRVTATLKEFGEDATITVEARDYESEADMFVDAIHMNSGHGSNLTPYDRVRCITVAEEFKIDPEELARALRTSPDDLEALRITRTARTKGASITPIKHGLGHLAGRRLSKLQQEGNESYGGLRPLFYVNQVLLLIEKDLIDDSDGRLVERLAHLRDTLNGMRLEVRKEA